MKTKTILMLFLACFLAAGCGLRPVTKERAFLMGTVVDITVHHNDPAEARRAAGEAFREAERLERLLSFRSEGSEVALINRSAGGGWVRVSEDTFRVLEKAVEFGEASGGAFDVTVAPLMELWGFAAGPFRRPGEDELRRVLPLVDYRKIQLDADRMEVRLSREGMKIDLGGMAKGYIVDRMASILRASGVSGALVNAGGDIYAFGKNHWGGEWRVGVRHPRKEGMVAEVVEISGCAVATSGDYQKHFMHEGIRYSHIIDPRRGAPARGVIGVTVIADSAADADALATALFVMGEEKGGEMLSEYGARAMIFTENREEGKWIKSTTW